MFVLLVFLGDTVLAGLVALIPAVLELSLDIGILRKV